MGSQLFKTSPYGQMLLAGTGMLGRPMTACSFGTSHMTGLQGFAATLAYTLAVYHDAYLTFDHRKVLTSVNDATVVANRGDAYATATAGSSHMVGAQLTQFNTDVAAGRRFDVLFTDAGLYNDNVTDQAGLDTALARLITMLTAFFNPAGNAGQYAVIQGTFGQGQTLHQSWSAMMKRLEATSGGRVRFYDAAAAMVAPKVAVNTWTFRNGGAAGVQAFGSLGAGSGDGTHASFSGSRYLAPELAPILLDICPRRWPRGGGYFNSDYDPVNLRYGDVFGSGAGMIGTQGLDQNLNGGDFSGNVVGRGGNGLFNTWYLNFSGSPTATPSITTSNDGRNEQTIALGGTNATGYVRFQYRAGASNINNSVATRKFMAGIEVEYVGVTAAVQPTLWMGAANAGPQNDIMPVPNADLADVMPDATSTTFRLRFLRPMALTGGSQDFGIQFSFGARAPAGTIKIRRPWWMLVEE